ncbi:serine hydrolase domain-containing protein [Actinoallomurus rhizosphaericola]|uniref:serine hydrolase domain-containing protein n=1 Tax=Actinoallomurus rhizosphaericola TaxID=2952536 RepID=UPI0020927D6A|nr:serine hydrolase domain-containing protein [Actinoallomurus rhizosphaericola]MCO5997142.1 beta-lactamase family protein [Actinoallomurus rhizosphaericola]
MPTAPRSGPTTDWTELPPRELGADPSTLSRALDLVHARGGRAQLCVLREGRVLLDRSVGCGPDALFCLFSAGKPFVALLVHLLAQRGDLSLDDRVAEHWPEFGRWGKEDVTVRQVLRHRSGVPVARSVAGDALVMRHWGLAVREVERARPRWPPGQVPAYHILTYGVILGELARRVGGAPVHALLREAFLDPLGLRDVHLGLSRRLWPRHVPVRATDPAGRVTAGLFNRRSTREAVIPSANVSATARDLARFYQALLDARAPGGARILEPSTVEEATRPSSDGEIDRFLGVPIRWAQGFQLGGPVAGGARSRPMGGRSSPRAFGHNGSNCCIAWADPSRDLVFAYLTDLLPPRRAAGHLGEVADAVLAACR